MAKTSEILSEEFFRTDSKNSSYVTTPKNGFFQRTKAKLRSFHRHFPVDDNETNHELDVFEPCFGWRGTENNQEDDFEVNIQYWRELYDVPTSCLELFDKYALPIYDGKKPITRKMTAEYLRQFFEFEMFHRLPIYRAAGLIQRTHLECNHFEKRAFLNNLEEPSLRTRIFRGRMLTSKQFQIMLQNSPRFAIPNIRDRNDSTSERLNKYYISCETLKPEICVELSELFEQINHILNNSVHCLQLPIDSKNDQFVILLKTKDAPNNDEEDTENENTKRLNDVSLELFLQEYSLHVKLPAQILLLISDIEFDSEKRKKLFELIEKYPPHRLHRFPITTQGCSPLPHCSWLHKTDNKYPTLRSFQSKIASKMIVLYSWKTRQKPIVTCITPENSKDRVNQSDYSLEEFTENLHEEKYPFATILTSDLLKMMQNFDDIYTSNKDSEDGKAIKKPDHYFAIISSKIILLVIDDDSVNDPFAEKSPKKNEQLVVRKTPNEFWSEMIRMGIQGLLRNCEIVDMYFKTKNNHSGFILKPSHLQNGALYRLQFEARKDNRLSRGEIKTEFRLLWHNIPCKKSKIVLRTYGHQNDIEIHDSKIVTSSRSWSSFNDQFNFKIRLPEATFISFEVYIDEQWDIPAAKCLLPLMLLRPGVRRLDLEMITMPNDPDSQCLPEEQFLKSSHSLGGTRAKMAFPNQVRQKLRRNRYDKRTYRNEKWSNDDGYKLMIQLEYSVIGLYTLY